MPVKCRIYRNDKSITEIVHPTPAPQKDALADITGLIRENIVVKRVAHVGAADVAGAAAGVGSFSAASSAAAGGASFVAAYVHGRVGEDISPSGLTPSVQMGKAAAVVLLSSGAVGVGKGAGAEGADEQQQIGRRLAMHVVAAKPTYLSQAEVPSDVMAREAAIFRQQSLELANKPPDVVEKVIRGKVLKRMGEVCLLSQSHMAVDGGPVVGKYLGSLQPPLACRGFVRWSVGSE